MDEPSRPEGRGGALNDAQPLLRAEEAASTSSSSAVEQSEEASSSAPAPTAQGRSFSAFLSWLRGRRAADAQPLSSEDDGDGSELEEVQRRPPQVAVVVEAAAEAEAGARLLHPQLQQQGAQQQQQQQRGAQQQQPDQGSEAAAAASSAASSSGDAEIEARASSGSPRIARLPSRGPPTCLICLEEFRQEEFVNGSALRLQCNCRGDLALRHRECVMKWVQVKGSNVCELCKAEIRNIPAPPPRPAEADLPQLDEAYFHDPSHIHDFMPSSQDLVFDCIRVTWVAMIVSILFFEMNLGAALWTGLLAGFAYSIMVRLMYRQHFYAMRRLAEQQAAARRDAEAEAAAGASAAPAPHPPVVTVV